ncbi:MAG: TldD/PmbA family protein [Candidatus Eremiobacteraeota bacterium]|nr:TldD/PmbA family protein [Candidatus Eremiobacteraeota bacterium]
MNSAAREEIAARLLTQSPADQTEVVVYDQDFALTRFTQNAIHQNVAHSNSAVSIRAIIDNRTAVVQTNRLDEHSLQSAVDRACGLARLAPSDKLTPRLPPRASYNPPEGAYVEQTARATPQLRAQISEAIFRTAEAQGLWAAGYATTSSGGVSVANSTGARASFDGTDCAVNIKMNARDSTGYSEFYGNDVSQLDAAHAAAVAADKAQGSRRPISASPGKWTVIIEPAAFGELLSYLIDHFSAQSYDDGSSFLSNGLGKRYAGDNVTIVDDFSHSLAPGMPFDFEGTPTEKVSLLDAGVAKAIVTDSYWATKLSRANTGHALPAPNAQGPQASHLVVLPGSRSREELIAQTKRGLLISRFWYIRTVDRRQTTVTGMTRDGTFMIENGVLGGGIRNMRFNQSLLETLRNCEFASELRRTGGYSYSLVVPTVKVDNFHFTSGTDF